MSSIDRKPNNGREVFQTVEVRQDGIVVGIQAARNDRTKLEGGYVCRSFDLEYQIWRAGDIVPPIAILVDTVVQRFGGFWIDVGVRRATVRHVQIAVTVGVLSHGRRVRVVVIAAVAT